jgi:hypothetical protein
MSLILAVLSLASDPQIVDKMPKTEATSHLATLESLLAEKKYLNLRETILNPKSKDELSESLIWLRDHWLEGNSAFVPMMYGLTLWLSTEKVPDGVYKRSTRATAVASMLYFYGVIGIDGARCADPTAPINRLNQFPQIIPDLMSYIATMSPEQQKDVVEVAVGVEAKTAKKRDEVGDLDFMCVGGLRQISYGLSKGGATTELPAKPGQFGRQIGVDGSGYKPESLPAKIWQPVAKKAREEMSARLERLIASINPAKK